MRTKFVIERAKKLLELAQRGCDGERETAQKFLDQLLEKYGFSLEDLSVEARSIYWIKVKNKADHKQILYQVLSTFDVVRAFSRKGTPSDFGIECTKGQFVEIQIKYEIYIRDFERQFAQMKKDFLSAFISKNEIFNQNKELSPTPKTEKEIEDILRAQDMAKNIDKSNIFVGLENKEKIEPSGIKANTEKAIPNGQDMAARH